MLCFVLEEMETLKEFNVEDDAACRDAGIEVLERAQHAKSSMVPQLWVIGSMYEELVGNADSLNEELDSGQFVRRLERAGIAHLSLDVDPELGW